MHNGSWLVTIDWTPPGKIFRLMLLKSESLFLDF